MMSWRVCQAVSSSSSSDFRQTWALKIACARSRRLMPVPVIHSAVKRVGGSGKMNFSGAVSSVVDGGFSFEIGTAARVHVGRRNAGFGISGSELIEITVGLTAVTHGRNPTASSPATAARERCRACRNVDNKRLAKIDKTAVCRATLRKKFVETFMVGFLFGGFRSKDSARTFLLSSGLLAQRDNEQATGRSHRKNAVSTRREPCHDRLFQRVRSDRDGRALCHH